MTPYSLATARIIKTTLISFYLPLLHHFKLSFPTIIPPLENDSFLGEIPFALLSLLLLGSSRS
jgi:hypothetical protein